MLRIRIIPCLQLVDNSLVKSIKFKNINYIGDPINTVRIFNELEVDELCFLDIRATDKKTEPNFKILSEIANECFMPLSYGGGIKDLETARKILAIGFEKIVINSAAFDNLNLLREISSTFGAQSLIVAIDVKKTIFGNYHAYYNSGKRQSQYNPLEWAKIVEEAGAGELLITSINNEGTWKGFDSNIIKLISENVSIPVIANGGAGSIEDIKKIIHNCNVSAVALGSMVVYQQKNMGILINFPDKDLLETFLC